MKRLTVKLSEELHNQAKEKAREEDITLSQKVRAWLRAWVGESNDQVPES